MMTTEAPQRATPTNGKSRWFQLGLVSAGAAAPLIARWRSLRAAEQAQALREQASDRWSDALNWVTQSRTQETLQQAQDAIQDAIQQALPQAQDGLRQAGKVARQALRRAPASELPDMPPPSANRRVNTTLWLVGVGVGMAAAGVVAYVVLRNRMSGAADDDALIELPLTPAAAAELEDALAPTANAGESDGPAITAEPPADEPGIADPLEFSDEDAEGAEFVGNIHSRVYHPGDSNHLPAPQHRIYFATEDDAKAAGFRADSAELASRATDLTSPAE